jgi:hypothetical protein
MSNVQMMRDLYDGLGRADMPTVLVEARYTGTYKQTGKKLDAQVCHVWKIRDGKVMSFQQYTDTAQLQDVAGTR